MKNNVKATKWWQSSNFWMAAIMTVAGVFVGFTESMAETAVSAVFAIAAAGKMLHNYFKSAEIDWKTWVLNSNFLNYALIIITTFIPSFSAQWLQTLQDLVGSIIDGNISGIIAAIFSIATILYNIFRKPADPADVKTTT